MTRLVFGVDRVCQTCWGRGFTVREKWIIRPAFPSEIAAQNRHGKRKLTTCTTCLGAGILKS